MTFLGLLFLGYSFAKLCKPAEIPLVGTDLRCTHNATGCPKRALGSCAWDGKKQECKVACANECTTDGPCVVGQATQTETWQCIPDSGRWEMFLGAKTLVCESKPCPPFPIVRSSLCRELVSLGYAIRNGTCQEITGCESDRKRHAKGELFLFKKPCEQRIRACHKQMLFPPPPSKVVKPPTAFVAPRQTIGSGPSSFPPGSRAAVERDAASLSGGPGAKQPLLGSWSVGDDVDAVLRNLQRLNPNFNFRKNNQWEAYPLVYSDRFARLLYDDNNKLVRIDRQ